MAGLDLEDVLSADDFQARAKRNLDKPLYEYFASGTDDGAFQHFSAREGDLQAGWRAL